MALNEGTQLGNGEVGHKNLNPHTPLRTHDIPDFEIDYDGVFGVTSGRVPSFAQTRCAALGATAQSTRRDEQAR